ncbi:hypothetical protein [Streptosporangium sp. V21-05]|uniref:hypothetical protein n=1 Tax=Streptosporangium sp. V21-05 TaxID=3446115 RepID=UPI003F53C654
MELRAETGAARSDYDVFSGRVVATAPGIGVQTPFSVFRERPSADVTVTSLDRTGAPAVNAITMVAGPANGLVFYAMGAESTFRVPPGTYFAATLMPGDDGTSTVAAHPDLAVTGKLDLVLDGRKARDLDITVPGGSAAPVSAGYAADVKGAEAWRTNYPVVPGIAYPAGSLLPPVAPPRTRTEYYAGNLAWEPSVDESARPSEDGGFPVVTARGTSYRRTQ